MPATSLADLDALPDPTERLHGAGQLATTVAKAATWAELPDDVALVLTTAADAVDRYAHGYLPPDDTLDDLAAAVAAFVTTMRERARAARRNAA